MGEKLLNRRHLSENYSHGASVLVFMWCRFTLSENHYKREENQSTPSSKGGVLPDSFLPHFAECLVRVKEGSREQSTEPAFGSG